MSKKDDTTGRAETAEKNYRYMVDRAAGEHLDGYRELGAKCARLEEQVAGLTRERDHLKKFVVKDEDGATVTQGAFNAIVCDYTDKLVRQARRRAEVFYDRYKNQESRHASEIATLRNRTEDAEGQIRALEQLCVRRPAMSQDTLFDKVSFAISEAGRLHEKCIDLDRTGNMLELAKVNIGEARWIIEHGGQGTWSRWCEWVARRDAWISRNKPAQEEATT